jgi:hypothetical protein
MRHHPTIDDHDDARRAVARLLADAEALVPAIPPVRLVQVEVLARRLVALLRDVSAEREVR